MEMLCDWNSFVTLHAGGVQATCAISSIVDLQNLLGTMLVLRVVFNLKTNHRVASTADSQRAKRGLWRWVFIVAGLAASSVRHCCYNVRHDWRPTTGVFRGVDWRVQRRGRASWEREEEKASNRSCPSVARQLQFEDLLHWFVLLMTKFIGFKVYSTHWSCKGSSCISTFPAQLKSWLN